MKDIAKLVEQYRKKDLFGNVVNLSPLSEIDLPHIVRMRNNPKMRYYLNQAQELTLDDQKTWFDDYLQRDNDIYWVIKDKNGHVIGTDRLYNITSDKCEQGSLMIDDAYAMSAPYAAEAIMLSIDFAFDVLGVNTIVNKDRHDNKNMNSITKRFGFKFLSETDIRGVKYNYYELYPGNYKKQEIDELLQLWIAR